MPSMTTAIPAYTYIVLLRIILGAQIDITICYEEYIINKCVTHTRTPLKLFGYLVIQFCCYKFYKNH